jgi:hypothetical protein
MPKATKPVRRQARGEGGYLRADGRRARRREQERRAARSARSREAPLHRRTGTVLEDDFREHVGDQLRKHATAVQRAAAIKRELERFAAALAR